MKTNPSPALKTNRLTALLALLAIFAVASTITFGARRVLGRPLDSQPTDADLKSARLETAAAIPHLPDDTEDKLAAALYPNIAPLTAISDPFSDRAGLANPNPQTSTKLTTLSVGPVQPAQPLIPDRAARLSQWQQSLRTAVNAGLPLPSITTAYMINEVAPTGKFEMNGRDGAWLYIEAERRTIPANVGAKFYDGTMVGVNANGVQFRTSAAQTKTVPWNRQDEMSSPVMPSMPSAGDMQKTPVVAPKAVSQERTLRPNPIQNEYGDLQQAVTKRYAPKASNIASTTQPQEDLPASPQTKPAASTLSTPSSNESNDDLTAEKARPLYNHPYRPASGPAYDSASNIDTATLDGSTAVPLEIFDEPAAEPSHSPETIKAQPSPTPSPALPVTAATKKAEAPAVPRNESAAVNSRSSEATTAATPEAKNPLCDTNYRGARISISNESGRPLSLLTFVNKLNSDYAANIVLDYDIQETPIRITVTNAPWTSILRTVLDLNDLDIVCVDGIAQVAKRQKIALISEQKRKSAPIVREVFKLKYLQPTAGGRSNLAGQTQSSGGASIQTLENAIREILKAGGDARGEARQVPGHNELLVAATQQQMDEVRDLIARVDRPGYQVKISALVYTANENRLRDIGSQLSIGAFNTTNTNIGGISTLPNISNTTGSSGSSGNGTQSGQGVAGRNPGGIPGLLTGMRQPGNGLGASNPLVTIGGGMVFPNWQFAYQITAAQQQGAVNIQSRPFGIVSDGETLDLNAGIQIPVVTTTIAGGAPFQSGQVQFIEASRITQITPQVAENDQGQPSFVTLNLRLENNSVDTSLGTFNGVPGVNRQSLQTVLRLRNGETAVIGGLAADQVSNSKSKVPGLGDIPLLGNLFKHKQNQENRDRLYFAITVEVIPVDAAIPQFQAPADAFTAQPPPPKAQKPSPFEKH